MALGRRLHPEQDVGEVGLRVDGVGFAGGDERVQARDVGAGLVATDKEVILSLMLSSALSKLCRPPDYAQSFQEGSDGTDRPGALSYCRSSA